MTVRKLTCHLMGLAAFIIIALGIAPYTGDTTELLTAEVYSCAASDVHIQPVTVRTISKSDKSASEESKPIRNSSSVIPYTTKATWGEFLDILAEIRDEDPTANKSIDEPGQNTKNNVAITLIKMAKGAKAVKKLDFKLEPYNNQNNVFEVCAYYTPLFGKETEIYHTGIIHNFNTKTIYMEDNTGILGIGFDFNFDFDTFSSSQDPWQRNFGFCKTYDQLAFLIGDVIDTSRLYFTADGQDWMIQIWKGIYSYNMLGAEIGIYKKPVDRTAKFYDCATDLECMPMQFTVYLGDEILVQTDEVLTWWLTKFKIHSWKSPAKLTLEASIKMPNKNFVNAFTEAIDNAEENISYTVKGTTVYITWPASK